MNEEILQQLYQAYGLSKKGTFDEFKREMQDSEIRKQFFTAYGLDKKGTFDEFERELGFVQQPKESQIANREYVEGDIKGSTEEKAAPHIQHIFNVNSATKRYTNATKAKGEQVVAKLNDFAAQRSKELQAGIKTDADLERARETFKQEIGVLQNKLVEEAEFEVKPVFEELAALKQSPLENKEYRERFAKEYQAQKMREKITPILKVPGLGNLLTNISVGAGDILPGGIAAGTAGNISLDYGDEILQEAKSEYNRAGNYNVRFKKTKEEAVSDYINRVGKEQYEKERADYETKQLERKTSLLDYAKGQHIEAEASTTDFPKTWEEAKAGGFSGIGSYVLKNTGQSLGLAAPTLVASAVNPYIGGAVGYVAMAGTEKGEAFELGVSKLEESTGLSRDEIFKQNLDATLRETSTRSGAINGLLEYIGTMSAVGKLVPKNVIVDLLEKAVKNKALNAGGQLTLGTTVNGLTEWLQVKNTNIAALQGDGYSFKEAYDLAMLEDNSEDFIAGIAGSSLLSAASATKTILTPSEKLETKISAAINQVANTGDEVLNKQIDAMGEDVIAEIKAETPELTTQESVENKSEINDTQNQTGLPSALEEGQAPQQEEPQQVTSSETTSASGVLQTPEVKETTKEIESVDKEGNLVTKQQTLLDVKFPGIGRMEGYIVEDAAEIAQIYADKEDGKVKRGGGLYKTAIDYLKSRGVKTLVVTFQSPDSRKALESAQKKGLIKLAENPAYMSDPANMKELNELYADLKEAKTDTGKNLIQEKINSLSIPTRFEIVQDKEGVIKGTSKSKETVTTTISKASEETFNAWAKGIMKGVTKGQEAFKAQIDKVKEAFKKYNLSDRQQQAVLGRLQKIKVASPGSFSKLTAFIDKVSKDAEYSEKLSQAEALKARIKSKQSANVPANYKIVAKDFLSIDPSYLNIDEYIAQANAILKGFAPVVEKGTSAELMEKWVTENPGIDVADARRYIDESRRTIFQQELEEIGLSKEDVDAYENDTIDKDYENYEKKEKILEQLKTHAWTLQQKLPRESEFKNSDLETLEASELIDYIKVVGNILTNNDFSGAGKLKIALEKEQRLTKMFDALLTFVSPKSQKEAKRLIGVRKDLAEKIKHAKKKGLDRSKLINERVKATDALIKILKLQELNIQSLGLDGISNLLDVIYSNQDRAAEIRRLSGWGEVTNAWGRVKEKMHQVWDNTFSQKVKEINKRYNVDLMSAEEQAKSAMLSELANYYIDPTEHIASVTKNIQESIDRVRADGRTEVADMWQKVFDSVKQVKSADEAIRVFKEKYPATHALWQFATKNVFDDKFTSKAEKTTTSIYNKAFLRAQNYLPTVFSTLKGDVLFDDAPRSTTRPVQSGHTLEAKRTLGDNRIYNMDNYWSGVRNAYRDTLYDSESAEGLSILDNMLKSPEFQTILGGSKNTERIKKFIQVQINGQRGVGERMDSDIGEMANNALSSMANIARVMGLGKITGGITQYIPALLGAATHLGPKYMNLVGRAVFLPKSFVDGVISNSAAIARADIQAGVDLNPVKNLLDKTESKSLSILRGTRALSDKAVHLALTSTRIGDVKANHTIWAAAYMKKLDQLGVKNVDLEQEYNFQEDEKRQQARAYADQVTDTMQLETNAKARGELTGGGTGTSIMSIMRNVVLPFAGFPLQTKRRMVRGIDKMRIGILSNSKKPAEEGLAQFSGALFEALGFVFLKYGVILPLVVKNWEKLFEWLFELDEEDDDEKDKKSESEKQQFRAQLLKEAYPIYTVGKAEAGADWLNNQFNFTLAKKNGMIDEEMTYDEFMKDPKAQGPLYKKKVAPQKAADDYGLYGTSYDEFARLYNTAKEATQAMNDDNMKVSSPYGEKTIEVDDTIQNMALARVVMQFAPLIMGGEAKTAYEKVYRREVARRRAASKK